MRVDVRVMSPLCPLGIFVVELGQGYVSEFFRNIIIISNTNNKIIIIIINANNNFLFL